MHDGRDAITPLLLDLTSKQHEFVTGRVAANLKPFIGAFSHDARCKWPEVLAVLDPLIKNTTNVWPAVVGKQRTVAHAWRPELHATLKPGDYLPSGDHFRRVARGGFAAPGCETGRPNSSQNFAPIERGAQKWRGVAALGRAFPFCAMQDKRSADCGASIVRRGRYEDIGETARFPDQLIGHAVECDAAGKAQIVERYFAFEAPDQRHDRRIRRRLQGRRNIGMSRQNLRIREPRRAEQSLQSTRLGR